MREIRYNTLYRRKKKAENAARKDGGSHRAENTTCPEDICDAIACHTTGKNHMTLLDKILYLADYIEETRDFPGVDKARELAQIDIDSALLYCYDQTLTELVARGKLIHSDTIAAYNDMIGRCQLAGRREGLKKKDWRQESFETIRRKR